MATISYKCPNCGGELLFDPPSQQYKCPYCTSTFSQSEIEAMNPQEAAEEQAAQEETAAEEAQEQEGERRGEAVIYHCPSCGSEIVTDETTAATFCYYCHNPVVMSGKLSGEFLPDKIIPFKYGKEQAKQQFTSFLRSKKFIPASFYDEDQMNHLTGVYYPYWVYDSSVRGNLEADCTSVRKYVRGDDEITETSFYRISRGGQAVIDEMTANALQKSDRMLVENVQPFELEKAVPFKMSYLSGFVAEKRDMEKNVFEGNFRQNAQNYGKSLMMNTITGYTTVNVINSHFATEKERWSYVLLPVWVLTYNKDGKVYYYAMNGQTGNVCGKLPIDGKKLFLYSALIFLVVMAIALVGGYLL